MNLNLYKKANYNHGASFLKRFLWMIVSAFFFETFFPLPNCFKKMLLLFFGAKIGEGFVVKPRVKIKQPWKLKVGSFVWLGESVWIDNLGFVEIGSNVCISQGAMLLTGNHNFKKKTFDLIVDTIVLKDGVWIGALSMVGPGVVCGENSFLVAFSGLFKNMEENSVYRGNPAVFSRYRYNSDA